MDAVTRSDHVMLGLGVEAEQLRQALQERPGIDVAKGILMALYGYDEQGAFTALRRVGASRCRPARCGDGVGECGVPGHRR